jgi:hypothetical protein
MWAVAAAYAGPDPSSTSRSAVPPKAVHWVAEAQLGAGPDRVAENLRRAGAATVEQVDFRQPGAFARGALDAPGLLAQLHQAGVEPSWFDQLPASGPTFVVATGPEGRASYAFVGGRLQAVALALTAQAVAPSPDPFERDRLEPLRATVAALGAAGRVTARDDYGNPIAWSADRPGGTLVVRYDPRDRDAAVQVLLYAK